MLKDKIENKAFKGDLDNKTVSNKECTCEYHEIMSYAKKHNITYNQAIKACKCK